MEDVKKWRQVPAFGSWNFYDEDPIAKYFGPVRGAGLIQAHFCGEDGKVVFKVVSQQYQRKRKKGGGRREGMQQYEKERIRKPKPVDEDLYKIPPELLYQAPKKAKEVAEEFVGRVSRLELHPLSGLGLWKAKYYASCGFWSFHHLSFLLS
ncbi:putative nuclear receptor subfamily 4 group A member 3-like [Cocos nucifera]|nr:putative nuclear receptor subfamily 4 group A member 3-like [Cocos nucifera]